MKSLDLTSPQRKSLLEQLRSERDARMYRRILAILELDRGQSATEIAQMLGVDRGSIYDWVDRYRSGKMPMHGIAPADGRGRPSLWEDDDAERILQATLEHPPEDLGYAAMGWTVPLLRRHVATYAGKEISETSLRRHLKNLGWTWKRPRYVLKADPQRAKKNV